MNRVFGFIDVQNDFMNENGNLYVPNATSIKKNIKNLVSFAVQRKCDIFFTQDQHDSSDPEFKTFPPHCITDTPGAELIPEAKTKTKKAVYFDKKTYDVFDGKLGNKDIDKWLKDKKVTEVWLAGVAADVCIKAAALGLRKRNIDVYIFENAIAGVDEKNTETSIQEMKDAGCHFVKCVF